MSTDLKQDVLNAVRKANCPDYKQNSHSCWWCPCAEFDGTAYNCFNSKYDKPRSYKVKPRKVRIKR